MCIRIARHVAVLVAFLLFALQGFLPEGGQCVETGSTRVTQEKSRVPRLVNRSARSLKIGTSSIVLDVDKLEVVRANGLGLVIHFEIENTSGFDRTLGIELPEEGFVFDPQCRSHRYCSTPGRYYWTPCKRRERLVARANSRIKILLTASTDPKIVEKLDGKEIFIRVDETDRVRETYRIRISLAPDVIRKLVRRSICMKAFLDARKLQEMPSVRKLMDAAAAGDLESVKAVTAKGGDVNTENSLGITLLMVAARAGKREVAEFLISRGAKVDARDIRGMSALMYAASTGNLDTVKLLMDEGAEIHARDGKGSTVLMQASVWGNIDIVRYLIEKGADVNARDKEGKTILMRAAWRRRPEVLRLLIDKDADVNARDKEGKTVLMHAAEWQHAGIAELLIGMGAVSRPATMMGKQP